MCWNRSWKRAKRAMSIVLASLLILFAVLLFPAASVLACGTVGGGTVPAFSLQAGGYGAQAIVQPFYAQQLAQQQAFYNQQFVQPVFAQAYAQPLLQAGYGGVGAAVIVPQRIRQRNVQRVVVRHHH